MAKVPTLWQTPSGYDSVTYANAGFLLDLETNFHLLLETGGRLNLEDYVVTVKEVTSWTESLKLPSQWAEKSGTATVVVGVGDTRVIEQSTDVRITEQGDTRITEPNIFSGVPKTAWVEL